MVDGSIFKGGDLVFGFDFGFTSPAVGDERAVPRVSLLEIDYPTLVRDPEAGAKRIADFLGDERVPQRQDMPKVVKPQLHRQRSA
jgi:hypothetical protein